MIVRNMARVHDQAHTGLHFPHRHRHGPVVPGLKAGRLDQCNVLVFFGATFLIGSGALLIVKTGLSSINQPLT